MIGEKTLINLWPSPMELIKNIKMLKIYKKCKIDYKRIRLETIYTQIGNV